MSVPERLGEVWTPGAALISGSFSDPGLVPWYLYHKFHFPQDDFIRFFWHLQHPRQESSLNPIMYLIVLSLSSLHPWCISGKYGVDSLESS